MYLIFTKKKWKICLCSCPSWNLAVVTVNSFTHPVNSSLFEEGVWDTALLYCTHFMMLYIMSQTWKTNFDFQIFDLSDLNKLNGFQLDMPTNVIWTDVEQSNKEIHNTSFFLPSYLYTLSVQPRTYFCLTFLSLAVTLLSALNFSLSYLILQHISLPQEVVMTN